MPKEVDPDLRRSEFVDAAWRVIRSEGLSAATMRRVAAEANCTTGALTHYFSNREALLVEALRRADLAANQRLLATAQRAKAGWKRLQAILVEALPLDGTRIEEWKTRLAVWAAASRNEALRQENTRRYRQWSELLKEYLAGAMPRRGAFGREAVLLLALTDGLALRLLLHATSPETMQAAVSDAVEEVRFYLRALRRRYSEHDGRGRARFMRDRGR